MTEEQVRRRVVYLEELFMRLYEAYRHGDTSLMMYLAMRALEPEADAVPTIVAP